MRKKWKRLFWVLVICLGLAGISVNAAPEDELMAAWPDVNAYTDTEAESGLAGLQAALSGEETEEGPLKSIGVLMIYDIETEEVYAITTCFGARRNGYTWLLAGSEVAELDVKRYTFYVYSGRRDFFNVVPVGSDENVAYLYSDEQVDLPGIELGTELDTDHYLYGVYVNEIPEESDVLDCRYVIIDDLVRESGYYVMKDAPELDARWVGMPVYDLDEGKITGIGTFVDEDYAVLDIGTVSLPEKLAVENRGRTTAEKPTRTMNDRYGYAAIIVGVIIGLVIRFLLRKKLRKAENKKSQGETVMLSGSSCVVRGLTGRFAGVEFDLGQGICMGRDPGQCSIVFPAETKGVSRTHCRVWCTDGDVYLQDLSSSYGTFLENGVRLEAGKAYKVTENTVFYLADRNNSFQIMKGNR